MTAYNLVFRVREPMHHGFFGPSLGNARAIRRMRIVDKPGMPRVPCVSGNAIRATIRRIVFRDIFHRCELARGQKNHERLGPKKWDLLYAALANGGHLTGPEKPARTEAIRQARELMPPISVFGAALYTYLLPGHHEMGIAWLRCRETVGEPAPFAEDLVEEVSYVRLPDAEHQDFAVTGVGPMPTEIEVICRGATLDGWVNFPAHATEIERGVIGYGLSSLHYLGGKSGTGHGHVEVEGYPDPQPYIDWLAGTPDLLDRLVAFGERLGGEDKKPKGKKKEASPTAVETPAASIEPTPDGGLF